MPKKKAANVLRTVIAGNVDEHFVLIVGSKSERYKVCFSDIEDCAFLEMPTPYHELTAAKRDASALAAARRVKVEIR